MIACSPFREDSRPSFAIHLLTGVWIDSGSDSDEYRKGGFVKFLSLLCRKSLVEIEEYLYKKYNYEITNASDLKLNLSLEKKIETQKDLTHLLSSYQFRHPYLTKRGISETVQRTFSIGYCKESKAVTIPWHNMRGGVVNVKYRSVIHKRFWYSPDGEQIKRHLYGLWLAYEQQAKEVFIVESEIDCMYLWGNHFPSVAIGGSHISDCQLELLLKLDLQKIVIATDNDRVGRNLRNYLVQRLGSQMSLWEIHLPHDKKDVNECTSMELKQVCTRLKKISPSFLFHVTYPKI